MKRILDCRSSDFSKMTKEELLYAVAAGEGRTIACETIGSIMPMLGDITNAEFAASMGADILLLNMFDVQKPYIAGLPKTEPENVIHKLKELTGRPIGINLEPVDEKAGDDKLWKMSKGRMATAINAKKAKKQGVDFIVITGNPGNHVTNKSICKAIKEIRKELGDDIVLITGKMHASGELKEAAQNIINKKDIKQFVDAGADIILLPAPGTVPGITLDYIHELITYIHSLDKLAMTSIGTSQEGSDTDTIKRIAIDSKQAGADIHHIGDSGYLGIAIPENIMAYSIAIRGARHTY